MAITYEQIQQKTVTTSTTTSVVLDNIPNTYTDLIIVMSGAGQTAGTGNLRVQFNGDTSSGDMSAFRLLGSGTSLSPELQTASPYMMAGDMNNQSSTAVIQIGSYSNTTTYKSLFSQFGNATDYVGIYFGTWAQTSAVNTVTLISNGTYWTQNTTICMYGIKVA
jgi:hypothetical protein